MKIWGVSYLAAASICWGVSACAMASEPATVKEYVNDVAHGLPGNYSQVSKGTSVRDGEAVKTGDESRAELELPTSSITRLGANTIFNYSVESNEVDLQAGTVLFCKPPDARQLNIKTAAVTAGITGTTGFVSIRGEGKRKTYIIGLIEGHAVAHADNHPFPLGPGDILEFRPGGKPFVFAFDVPRFVKSSSLLKSFHSKLPNQGAIDRELAEYADEVNRGFIVPPSDAIDYSGDIPVLSTVVYSSSQNQDKGGNNSTPPPTPSTPPPAPTSPTTPRGGNPFSSYGH